MIILIVYFCCVYQILESTAHKILEMLFNDTVNVNCTNVNETEVPILTCHVVSKTCNNYRSKFSIQFFLWKVSNL